MIWNENIEWSNFGKEAHFVNSDDNGVDNFIFEGFQDNCAVFDCEFDCSSFGSVLDDSVSMSFVSEDGNNVTVSTSAMAFNLCQEGLL